MKNARIYFLFILIFSLTASFSVNFQSAAAKFSGGLQIRPSLTFSDSDEEDLSSILLRASELYNLGYYKNAFELYEKAAERGSVAAEVTLGLLYYSGQGVSQSYEKAAEHFRKAANMGNVYAEFLIGHMYYEGLGVSQSYETAAKWFMLCSDEGEPNCEFLLGCLYISGEGVEKSQEKGEKLVRRAAAQGNEEAELFLRLLEAGLIYSDELPAALPDPTGTPTPSPTLTGNEIRDILTFKNRVFTPSNQSDERSEPTKTPTPLPIHPQDESGKDDVFKEDAHLHQDDETAAAPSDEKLSAAGMILFEQGKQAYTDGDFDTARQLLEAALMLNIADARDLLDEIDDIINGSQIEGLYQSGLEAYRQRDYETALSCWEQTAALGDTRTQNTLGNMYYWGIQYGGEWVFDRSYEKAVKYYQMAIDNGNTDELENMISACEHLAIDFEHAGDKISAIDYYQMAADLGSSAAAAKVEELKGIPVTDESSGTKQDAEELLKLGLEAYEAENYTRALIYLEPAAEMDSPEALNTLAEMYKYYQGVPQDMEKAAALYQRSADLGDVHGQEQLAHMYQEGMGVEQSYEMAVKYYQMAADQDSAFAKRNLGTLYKEGKGVEQSLETAVSLYKQAALQEDPVAVYYLENLLKDDLQVPDICSFAGEMLKCGKEYVSLWGYHVIPFSGEKEAYRVIKEYVDYLVQSGLPFVPDPAFEESEEPYGNFLPTSEMVRYAVTLDYTGDAEDIGEKIVQTYDASQTGNIMINCKIEEGKLSGAVAVSSGFSFSSFP